MSGPNSWDTTVMLFKYEPSTRANSEAGPGPQRIRYLPLHRSAPARPSRPWQLQYKVGATEPLTTDWNPKTLGRRERRRSSFRVQWPAQRVPPKIFHRIIKYVSRDDIKAMRLVNKDFEAKVSAPFFHASVVPFDAQFYGMMDNDDSTVAGIASLIHQFGVSFEVTEEQLVDTPEEHKTQTGRFTVLAGLEMLAKDTARMKKAFSKLKEVKELALSIDSGTGWLNGSDRSVRACIFPPVSPVFGPMCTVDSRSVSEANAFWKSLREIEETSHNEWETMENVFDIGPLDDDFLERLVLPDARLKNPNTWPSVTAHLGLSSYSDNSDDESVDFPNCGVLVTTSEDPRVIRTGSLGEIALVPNGLNGVQMQWLEEAGRAQRAFLISYRLAVVEMPTTFSAVETLTLAKMPASLLVALGTRAFWDALPALGTVTILVLPEWRKIGRDEAGHLRSLPLAPSDGARFFNGLLEAVVAPRVSIKSLNIGWNGGGEDAEGMYARNANLLPSPIQFLPKIGQTNRPHSRVFPHVEHLTLTNCWVTPPVLEVILIKNHADLSLRKLTLNSVSLTMDPRTMHIEPDDPNDAEEKPWDVHFGGSWPDVINKISPGIIFADIEGASTDPPSERRRTALRELEFISCGYVRLPKRAGFDRLNHVDVDHAAHWMWKDWFEQRAAGLKRLMMETDDSLLGDIVQHIPQRELDALKMAWGMKETFDLGYTDACEAPEYDGGKPAGFGRFSGKVCEATDEDCEMTDENCEATDED